MNLEIEVIGNSIFCLAASGVIIFCSYPCLYEAFTGREPGMRGEKSSISARVASGTVGLAMNIVGIGFDYIFLAHYFTR